MRVLVFHGYLLRGTGSNVYNASLVAALVRLGHEVDLFCQDRHADEFDFVGAVADWDSGELSLREVRPAGATAYRPDIGGLLPVYVADTYEDVEARTFDELSDEQVDAYVEANVAAVSDVVARSRPDVALANHLIMGPVVLARALSQAGVPYAVKVHGSALEYTVKPYPRFLPYAREGIAPARGVLVGSRHTAESLWAALADPGLPARTRLGPPGTEIATFKPLPRGAALARLTTLAESLAEARDEPGDDESAFSRDTPATARAVGDLARGAADDRLVTFVGKLIVSKGIDLLLLAWPLVLAEIPNGRLAVVGFGAYRGGCERIVEAVSEGDLSALRELAALGRAEEGGPQAPLRFATEFLDWLDRDAGAEGRERYLGAAATMRDRVVFTGRLEHDEVADVLPACEAMVVPSTFPESFGMVAAEAAACGALPISAAHSGLAEVSRVLAAQLPVPVADLVSFPLQGPVVQSIASRLITWLLMPEELRGTARASLVETVAAHYSWESVARTVIAAAQGDLDALDPPR
ncbi:MAG TPA: glycosyltransferase [Solirubrobacteraceae bacterium]|nr:glycosyltransferase [Solirubrobacteraceae bacterium]